MMAYPLSGASAKALKKLSKTPLTAQREKRLCVLHQPPKRSGKSRHHVPRQEFPDHHVDEKTIAQIAAATDHAGTTLWVAKYKSGGDRSLKQTAAMWPPRVTVKRGWNS